MSGSAFENCLAQDRRDLDRALVRLYEAMRDNRTICCLTRRERNLLWAAYYGRHQELREGRFLGVELVVVDYELPYDERMAITGPPKWLEPFVGARLEVRL